MEDGDFFRTRRSQIFAQQGLPLFIQGIAALIHYRRDVTLSLRLRIDPVDAQARNLASERHCEVGRGVGRTEMHAMAALDQT